jgi:hypothetical protein
MHSRNRRLFQRKAIFFAAFLFELFNFRRERIIHSSPEEQSVNLTNRRRRAQSPI